jgi:hypothetical protein
VRLYDFIMYHALLSFVFGTDSLEEALKNSAETFKEKISHFYQLSFLNEEAKLKKFIEGFDKLQPDVFFIQEYSKVLFEKLTEMRTYALMADPT